MRAEASVVAVAAVTPPGCEPVPPGGRGLAFVPAESPVWAVSLLWAALTPRRTAAMAYADRAVAHGLSDPDGPSEVSLGHARLCSHHPSANHVTGSCAELLHLRQDGQPVPPNRVYTTFRAGV
jgi:hypothetical protein